MDQDRSFLPRWLVGAVCTALPVAWVLARNGTDGPLAPILLTALGLVVAFGVIAPVDASERAVAFAGGAFYGLIAGVLLAQPTPTCWLMSDVAWHTAKVARVAEGAWLEDPLLRVPTIYPFVFHLVLALPVVLGASLFWVMWAVSPLVLVLLGSSFAWMLRAFVDARRAVWGALALPFFFYAPSEGFAYLPNPFNASLAAVFLGLGACFRAERTGKVRWALAGGGALGLAGITWYGHLPWITAAVIVWGLRARRSALWTVLGASPAALVLGVHLLRLSGTGRGRGAAIVESGASEELAERAAGVLRNLTTLSGSAPLAGSAWWLGPTLLLLLMVAWRSNRGSSERAPSLLLSSMVLVGLALLGAGFLMTFWRPFSWRYGFLFYALALAFAARSRPFRWGRWSLPALAACAAIAPWFAGRGALLCLTRSRVFAENQAEGGAEVGRFLAERTRSDEPVFASNDTWDRVVGGNVPRPGLVARNGGIYNFAPADVVAPRWRAYQETLAATDADVVMSALAPYGFRYAVVGRDEAERTPGLGVVARSFERVLETPRYWIVDLSRRRP